MKNNFLLIPFFILLSFSQILPQRITDWSIYADMKLVKDVAVKNKVIWAASDGGAFTYQSDADSFATFTKTEGLNGLSLTAVTVDSEGKIWFGSKSGIIDVYNPASNSFKTILDIFNSDKSNKSINDLTVSGDTIFAATDFGVSLISAVNYSFYDTYFKYGSFSSNIKVNNAYKNKLIYLSTENGVAVQKVGAANLSAPESWNVYQTADGLPSNNVLKITGYDGKIIAATDKGLVYFTGTGWSVFTPDFNNIPVADILTVSDSLFILSNNNIFKYSNNTSSQIFTSHLSVNSIGYAPTLGVVAATDSGVKVINNGAESIIPNGPQSNKFPDLAVDNNGILWSASGVDISGEGFYEFDGKKWTNYNMANTKILPSNAYFSVFTAPDNTKYFGNWGHGFIKFKDGNIEQYDVDNTPMQGIEVNPKFLVITDFGLDSKGNLWTLNYGAIDRKNLAVLTADSLWFTFALPPAGALYYNKNTSLAVDQYDTKWIGSKSETKSGLYYFNENKTFDDKSDDKYGILNKQNGLNSDVINSVVLDKRGELWIGTNVGVNILRNNSSIFSSSTQFSISSVFSLRQQIINCIAVDPLNQKWVGTNQGLILVNSDGSNLLASYDSKNSPLLSNTIISVTIDENSGTVYVGTDKGLSSFKTPFIKPKESFSDLFIYPSPFKVGKIESKLTIDGLISDTDIKILNISGGLVDEFPSPGGRIAFWDGKDLNGNSVPTGIYLIVAYDKEGNNVKTGKIAVIKE